MNTKENHHRAAIKKEAGVLLKKSEHLQAAAEFLAGADLLGPSELAAIRAEITGLLANAQSLLKRLEALQGRDLAEPSTNLPWRRIWNN